MSDFRFTPAGYDSAAQPSQLGEAAFLDLGQAADSVTAGNDSTPLFSIPE